MAKLPSAIDFISDLQNEMRTREFTSVNEAQAQNYLSEYVCVEIIKALQKQIPKKPYSQQVEVDDYDRDCLECPSCDSFIGFASECKDENYQINYCPHCGQSLDWNIDFD